MRGYYVERKGGWDCHGLPVEIAVEQQLGITSKDEIEAYGIAEFNAQCRESVFELPRGLERADRADRLLGRPRRRLPHARRRPTSSRSGGRCADLGQGPALRGPQGRPVLPALRHRAVQRTRSRSATRTSSTRASTCASRSPRTAAPLQAGDELLVWTTTPWTLVVERRGRGRPRARPTCARATDDGRSFVLAEALVERVLGEGARGPRPLPGRGARRRCATSRRSRSSRRRATASAGHTVLLGDFVTAEDGTGLVHTALAFGEDDFRLGEQYGLNVVNPVRLDGTYDERIGPYAGPLRQGRRRRPDRGPARARAAAARRGATSTPTRTAGAAARRCSTTPSRPGTSRTTTAARPSCWRPTRRSTGTRRTSSTGASATGWRTTSTGRSRASATGARRCRSGAARTGHVALRRLASTSSRSCSGVRARGPAPAVRRRGRLPVRRVRRADAARARGDRRLVRLGRDAVRAVALAVRERGALRDALPGRLHLRGARPDARLVLLAARGLDAAVRPRAVRERRLPRPDPRRRRPEDVEVAGQHRRARGTCSTATAPTRSAGTSSPPSSRGTATASRSRRSARRCACSCCSCGTRTASTSCTRTRRTAPARAGPASATRARPLGPVAPARRRSTRSRERLDAYDATTAGRAIAAFVDDLSNWYVRRSRRRFWDGDRGRVRDAARLPA